MKDVTKDDLPPSLGHGQDQLDAGEYLTRIAHELLSPLTTLRLSLQVGRMRLQRGESIELSTVDRALAQVEEISSLVTKLRSAAHLVRGDSGGSKQRIESRGLLQQVAARIAREHGERSIHLEQGELSLSIFGDRAAIEVVFENLLDNACKFSPAHLPIRVDVSPNASGQVEFTVTDQGIGIPAASLERVFGMFFRAANASESSAHGFGLGLFIAREIVVRHAGRIWAESELGRGSKFHVTLPKALPD